MTENSKNTMFDYKVMMSIYSKEIFHYFNTPIAYIITIVFLLITGYFFSQPLFVANQSSIDGFLNTVPLLLTFFIPAITMRLFAEEIKTQTIEILLTFPVQDTEVLIAKYLSALTLILSAFFLTLIYPLTISIIGISDYGSFFGAYLGLFLTAGMLCAIGIFCSSMSKNQVIAFIIGFLISFVFYMIGKISFFIPMWLTPVTDFLGFDFHLNNISRGILDTRDFIYYFTVSGFFLFLTRIRLGAIK
jgi:ABC-2 type transport system permease protein